MGKLKIELLPYKTDYFPGETVSGVVSYKRKQNYDWGFGKGTVNLRFIGYEQAVLNPGGYPQKTETRVMYEKSTVLTNRIETGSTQSSAAWQFAFVMPTGLPGSYRHSSGTVKIVYEFQAELLAPGQERKETTFEIILRSQPNSKPIDAPHGFNECKFLMSGNLEMECSLDRGAGHLGEEIFVTVQLRNNSSKTIKGLKLSLVQTANIRGTSQQEIVKSYLFQDHFPVGGGKTFNGRISISIPINVEPSLLNAKLFSLTYQLLISCLVGDQPECTVALPIGVFAKPTHPPQSNVIVQNIVVHQYGNSPPVQGIPYPQTNGQMMYPVQQLPPGYPQSLPPSYQPQPGLYPAVQQLPPSYPATPGVPPPYNGQQGYLAVPPYPQPPPTTLLNQKQQQQSPPPSYSLHPSPPPTVYSPLDLSGASAPPQTPAHSLRMKDK